MYGSGYRIGGRLVLTAAHLFRGHEDAKCAVRSKETFGEVQAHLAWISDTFDLALLELPDGIPAVEATDFGRLASEESIVAFEMYAWPRWAWTRGPHLRSGGRHILGHTYLADTSPEKLLVIEPKREAGVAVGADGRSPWEGASGASIFSSNCLVAIQRQHQNPRRLASLEAEPIEHVVNDEDWISKLRHHEIDPSLRLVGHLDAWMIDPESVFRRVRIDRFVGRQWLTERVNGFLQSNSSGYLLIQGRAGTGKSAYLAHLARTLDAGCVSHFIETTPGRRGVVRALRNLTAQIVNHFQISQTALRNLLPDIGSTPDYLERLFNLASEQESAWSQRPFICIVDGLNESAPYAGSNVLDLPARLPQGFFVVASTQPVPMGLDVECAIDYVTLEDFTSDNRADIVEYVQNSLHDVPASTVKSIVDNAEDNWAYVFFVIAEIEDGTRSPSDITQLPRGIWQYYSQFWESWRDTAGRDLWVQKDLPLLTAIAAAQEVLPIASIAEMCGVDADYAKDLLSGQWLRFVVIENRVVSGNGEATPCIRPFNSSLVDFVHGEVNDTHLSESDRAFVRQLQTAVRSIHREIAGRYLKLWGDDLNALREDPELAKATGGYGWRHTVNHLICAGMFEEAMELIQTEWTATYPISTPIPGILGRLDRRRQRGRTWNVPRNAWFESHLQAGDVQAFLIDLEALLNDIDVSPNERLARTIIDNVTVLAMRRCAHEVLEAVPPAVVVSLARHGDWSPEQILRLTNQIEDPHTKARLLIRLLEYTTGELTDIVEVDALGAVIEVSEPDRQIQLIERLLPYLHGSRSQQARSRAFDVLSEMDAWPSQTLLSNIIDSLQPGEWGLFEDSMARVSPLRRLQLSLALLSKESDSNDSEVLLRSVVNTAIDEFSHLDSGADALFEVTCLDLATKFPDIIENYEPSYERSMDAILQQIREYDNSVYTALANLIRLDAKDEAVDLALVAIDHLLATEVHDDPMRVIQVMQGTTFVDQWAARMVGILVDALPEKELSRLEKRILNYRVPHSEFEAYQAISLRYLHSGLPKKAIQIARKIPDERVRHQLFARLADNLDERYLQLLRDSVAKDWAKQFGRTRFSDPRAMIEARARTLSTSATGIVPRLAQLGRHDEAIDLVGDIAPMRSSDKWNETISNAAAALDREGCMKLLETATKFDDIDTIVLLLAYLCPYFTAQDVLNRLPAFRLIGYFDVTIERISFLKSSRSKSSFSITSRTEALEFAISRLASLGHIDVAWQVFTQHFSDAKHHGIGVEMPHCVKELAPRLYDEPEKLIALIALHRNEAQAVSIRHAVPYIPADLAGNLLELAWVNDVAKTQALCLGSQLLIHSEDQRATIAQTAFDLTQQCVQKERWEALGFIAPYSDAARAEILAEEIDSATRVQLFQDALWNTTGELRDTWLHLARKHLNHDELYGLANYLPEDELRQVLVSQPLVPFTDRTLEAIVPSVAIASCYEDAYNLILGISETGARVRTASSIAEHLRDAEPVRLARMCRAHLDDLKSADRETLYGAVVALAPVLFVLGGHDAILELGTTITRGLRWWTDFASAKLGEI